MNKYQDKNSSHKAVPLTPNIENIKQQNKLKHRKKNTTPSIQPTQQPLVLDSQHGHASKSPKQYPCQNHPERKGEYHWKTNLNKRFCEMCVYTLSNSGEETFLDDERYEKTKGIESFKQRIEGFKQTLSEKENKIYEILSGEEQNYNYYIRYLNECFQGIINDLEQKHSQMNKSLCQCIQKRRKSISTTFSFIEQIKDSADRYVYDINRNYQDIINELSIENFRDVMKQYNAKIDYYHEHIVNKMELKQSINVYMPIHEFHRVLQKAAVSYYDSMNESKVQDGEQSGVRHRKERMEALKENRGWNPPRLHKHPS